MSDRQCKRLAFAMVKGFPGEDRQRNGHMARAFYAMLFRCSLKWKFARTQARRLGCDYRPCGGQRI